MYIPVLVEVVSMSSWSSNGGVLSLSFIVYIIDIQSLTVQCEIDYYTLYSWNIQSAYAWVTTLPHY